MKPRLTQPLFQGKPANTMHPSVYHAVRAYDCIWGLLYQPEDMSEDAIRHNARVNLEALGSIIEQHLGPEMFDADPRQLQFPDEILNPKKTGM